MSLSTAESTTPGLCDLLEEDVQINELDNNIIAGLTSLAAA